MIVDDGSPLVSVLIASYNRPHGLRRVLDDICKQTYQNLEIIVSDDCSHNDEIVDVLEEFSKKDLRIKYYIQNGNLKYFKNLNFLLKISKGKFLMWCDDDDLYHPRYIEMCLGALHENPKSETAFTYYYEAIDGGERSDKFPNQKPILRRLCIKNAYIRLLFYLFKLDGQGYCNIYYGLHRRTVLHWFDPEVFAKKYRFGSDQEFGMKSTSMASLALVKEELFVKTVQNVKTYLFENTGMVKRKSIFVKIKQMLDEYIYEVTAIFNLLPLRYAFVLALFSPLAFISLAGSRILMRFTR